MSNVPPHTPLWANFGWLLAERGWRILVGLAVSLLITRYLGPNDFGLLSFAFSLSAIAGAVIGLGVDDVLVRELVRRPDQAKKLLLAGLRIKLGSAVLAVALMLGLSWLLRPGDFEALRLVAWLAVGLLFLPADLVELWFHSQESMKPPALVRKGALALAALVRVSLVIIGAPVWCFAAATALELGLIGFAFVFLWRRRPAFDLPKGDWIDLRAISAKLLKDGFPLLLSGLLVVVTMHFDRLLLIRLAGESEVGLYAAAARMTELLYVLPVALGAASAPRLAALHASDLAVYAQTARKVTGVLIAVTIAVAGIVSIAAPYGIPLVLGEAYLPTARVWMIQIWMLVFVAIVSMRTRLWVIEGHTTWILVISAATLLLSVAGNSYFIPRFGAIGAAWSAVLAWAISALVLPWCAAGPAHSMKRWCGLANHK